MYVCMHAYIWTYVWAPWVLGIWGEGIHVFIFRELGGTGNYFKGAREQPHGFGNLGSPVKSKK